jgi:hypothetical protein
MGPKQAKTGWPELAPHLAAVCCFSELNLTKRVDLVQGRHHHLIAEKLLTSSNNSLTRIMFFLTICFNIVGDYERKLQIPVTPLCDRNATTVAKIQAGK